MEGAFKELSGESGFRTPLLTIVVVQRQSNYRIVPSQVRGVKAFEQNVRAGTCVDKAVMHPAYTEFLMVAHKTIQVSTNLSDS